MSILTTILALLVALEHLYAVFRPSQHPLLHQPVLRAFVRDHGLSAIKYQDYGWPAKDLDL